MSEAITKPALRYFGSKFRLAPWVIKHLPEHRIYVEPYGGSGAVLLRKPRSYAKVYNDKYGEVCNLFHVLRDPDDAARLTQLLILTPFARSEFKAAYALTDDPIERARRLVVRSMMGFSARGAVGFNPNGFRSAQGVGTGTHSVTAARVGFNTRVSKDPDTGLRNNTTRQHTTPATDWAHFPPAIAAITARLAGVVIEEMDALDLMSLNALDQPVTCWFVDPPYPMSSRGRDTNIYAYEYTDEDHRILAGRLRHLQGMVVLSGYRCPLYEDLFGDWHSIERPHRADGGKATVEVMWFNPAAWAAQQSPTLGLSNDTGGDDAAAA